MQAEHTEEHLITKRRPLPPAFLVSSVRLCMRNSGANDRQASARGDGCWARLSSWWAVPLYARRRMQPAAAAATAPALPDPCAHKASTGALVREKHRVAASAAVGRLTTDSLAVEGVPKPQGRFPRVPPTDGGGASTRRERLPAAGPATYRPATTQARQNLREPPRQRK